MVYSADKAVSRESCKPVSGSAFTPSTPCPEIAGRGPGVDPGDVIEGARSSSDRVVGLDHNKC